MTSGFLRRRMVKGARTLSVFMMAMLIIEFLDEFAYGTREAAWSFIRDDLNLTYTEIGLILGLPSLIAVFIEPIIGILSNMGYRRYLILGGGVVFGGSLALTGLSDGFVSLLIAQVISAPASGAFVGLAQAALMDYDTQRHEQNMARWTLAGSVGITVAPLMLGVMATIGFGWRGLFLLIGIMSVMMVVALRKVRFPAVRPDEDGDETGISLRDTLQDTLNALRDFSIVRWYVLFVFSDLLLDVLHGFIALYFVDVVGVDPATGALAVVVWTSIGLIGDIALIPLLERVEGLRYLRFSAAVSLFLFPAFMLVEGLIPKLILLGLMGMFNAGWYSILAAQAYTALIGRSGTEMIFGVISSAVVGLIPLLIGVLAESFGLGGALWICLLAPIALLVGLPRQASRQTTA